MQGLAWVARIHRYIRKETKGENTKISIKAKAISIGAIHTQTPCCLNFAEQSLNLQQLASPF